MRPVVLARATLLAAALILGASEVQAQCPGGRCGRPVARIVAAPVRATAQVARGTVRVAARTARAAVAIPTHTLRRIAEVRPARRVLRGAARVVVRPFRAIRCRRGCR